MKVFENKIDVELLALFFIMVLLNSICFYRLYEGDVFTDYSLSIVHKLCNENGGMRSITLRAVGADNVKCGDGSEFYIDLDIDGAAKFKNPIKPSGEVDVPPVK